MVIQVRAGVLLWGPAAQRQLADLRTQAPVDLRTQVPAAPRRQVEALLKLLVGLQVPAEALPSPPVGLQVQVEALLKVLADQLQSQGLRSQSLSTLSPLVAILVL